MCNVGGSNLAVNGCTFGGNTAAASGGGMYSDDNANVTMVNCIFWGDSPEALYYEPASNLQK